MDTLTAIIDSPTMEILDARSRLAVKLRANYFLMENHFVLDKQSDHAFIGLLTASHRNVVTPIDDTYPRHITWKH